MHYRIFVISILLITINFFTNAETFSVPDQVPTTFGKWYQVEIAPHDSLSKIALKNDVSVYAIQNHNVQLAQQKYIHPGQTVIIPRCYWLPQAIPPGEILINIATQTLFYHPADQDHIMVFPVTVGKTDDPTPLGDFYIKAKRQYPTWIPGAKVREAYKAKGEILPATIPGGDNNPLGAYAMYLNKPTYLIHTAINIDALGGEQSFGCVRMFKQDIAQLYPAVPVNTKVTIIDTPIDDPDAVDAQCGSQLSANSPADEQLSAVESQSQSAPPEESTSE